MFDAEVCAELVELLLDAGGALAQTEHTIGEFLPVISQDLPNPDWAGPVQIAQKAAGIGSGLGFEVPDKDPASGPVNRHEQLAARGFFSHLRQILHIDMQLAGLVGGERFMLWSGAFRLQVTQIAHLMPPQTPVQPRTRNLRVEELPDDSHSLLRRSQRGLQPVRCAAAVMQTIAMLPFVNSLFSRPEPLRRDLRRLCASLDGPRTFGVVVA